MNVPILRIPFGDEELRAMQRDMEEVLSSGMLTMGEYTREFEQRFAAYTGARHAVSCSSGTAALELILRALGIEGCDVVVPTNTFLATALAVMHAGNRVLFADSDPETLCLDLEDVERRLDSDTGAVLPVHIGGSVDPRIEALVALGQERGFHVVEDCAHAHGCRLHDRHAGTFGAAGAFSFFPTKVLTTGEGGMVITDDEELAERVRSLRNHGKWAAAAGRVTAPGYNFRLSELTALVGVHQLEKAEAVVRERRRIAAYYDRALPAVPGVRPLRLGAEVSCSYYKYVVFLDEDLDREAIKSLMQDQHGVALTGEVYAELCHSEPLWERYTYCGRRRSRDPVACHRWPACGCRDAQDGFPGAEVISRRHVCLPLYPGLTREEQEHVIASLRESVLALRADRQPQRPRLTD